MSAPLKVNSEIGRLKKVLLHRPGKEIENLIPDYLEKLLFDDIPFLEAARIEHLKTDWESLNCLKLQFLLQ